ncbi:hypothetical protein RI367_002385 [Sorochytrium milnesiophthora]
MDTSTEFSVIDIGNEVVADTDQEHKSAVLVNCTKRTIKRAIYAKLKDIPLRGATLRSTGTPVAGAPIKFNAIAEDQATSVALWGTPDAVARAEEAIAQVSTANGVESCVLPSPVPQALTNFLSEGVLVLPPTTNQCMIRSYSSEHCISQTDDSDELWFAVRTVCALLALALFASLQFHISLLQCAAGVAGCTLAVQLVRVARFTTIDVYAAPTWVPATTASSAGHWSFTAHRRVRLFPHLRWGPDAFFRSLERAFAIDRRTTRVMCAFQLSCLLRNVAVHYTATHDHVQSARPLFFFTTDQVHLADTCIDMIQTCQGEEGKASAVVHKLLTPQVGGVIAAAK